MAVAAEAGVDVELISYGHTVIQAANLHVALAFGRTTYFEQAVPVEPWEHARAEPDPHRFGRAGSCAERPGPGHRARPGHGGRSDDRAGRRRRSAMTIGTDDQEGANATMRFEGRGVIVTGGSRGIGRGIVDAFLDEGARVLATDVLGEELAQMRDAHPHVDRLAVHTADLADAEQVRDDRARGREPAGRGRRAGQQRRSATRSDTRSTSPPSTSTRRSRSTSGRR